MADPETATILTANSINPQLDLTTCIHEASERKNEGNAHFRAGRWTEALVEYQAGIRLLPVRPEKKVPNSGDSTGESLEPPVAENEDLELESQTNEEREFDQECASARAVLYANIGACHVKLGDHKEAVEACSKALLDDPTYQKALLRRATSNEAINSWSSLGAAQTDYNTLLKMASSPSQTRELETKLNYLKPRLEAAQKQETAEMMSKLKGIGNSILGNFGLSTDNFKFEPNGQGGYSVNFSR